MSPSENILNIAPSIIRSYRISFLLPMLAGGNAVWFAMPLTEFIVAVYVVIQMRKYTKQLGAK